MVAGPSPTTVTVAFANSPEWVKTHAQFALQGKSTDIDHIWRAINSLPQDSAGNPVGTVEFAQGSASIFDPSSGLVNASPFNMNSGLVIRGAGPHLTKLRMAVDAPGSPSSNSSRSFPDRYMFRVLGSSHYQMDNWAIEDLGVTCSGISFHGIGVKAAENGVIRNVRLEHTSTAGDEGVAFTGDGGGVRRVLVENLHVSGFLYGLEFRGGDDTTENVHDITVRGYKGSSCVTAALAINVSAGGNAPKNIWFWDTHLWDNKLDGGNFDGGENIWLLGGSASSNTRDGINISDTAAKYFRVENWMFQRNRASGLVVQGSRHLIFGNTFESNSASGIRSSSNATENIIWANVATDTAATQKVFNDSGAGSIYRFNFATGNSADYSLGAGGNSSFTQENDS